MNNQNLKPIQSTDEAREKGKLGGIKSGEVRREKRKLRKILTELLENPQDDDMSKEGIAVALVKKAMTGDIKAIETIMKIIGEMPTPAMQTRTDEEIKNDPFFIDI